MNPIVIYGKYGQVASALINCLEDKAISFASRDYDFSTMEKIKATLEGINPAAIINAAAYTDVNKAESEEDAAYKANAIIPGLLAEYCRERNIPLVSYSTDYVFSGDKPTPYNETDLPSPLNAYGRTKLAGEEKIREVGGKCIILRTSWVYDAHGKNFFTTMLKLGMEREILSVVADQHGAPTYAEHLAKSTVAILNKAMEMGKFPSGIYHLCNSGETTWHGFANEIFSLARTRGIDLKVCEVKPILASEFPSPAKRPHNSRMDCLLANRVFGITMPDWREGVGMVLR